MQVPVAVRPVFAACWPVLAAAALLAAPPAHAQQGKDEKPAATTKEAGGQKDQKKDEADVEKARDEVKRLRDEMDRLHEQMLLTAGKLRRAEFTLFEKERRGDGGRSRRHGHWVGLGWGPRHWHAWGHPGGSDGSADLERKVDRLQKEVEQLRHDLGQKK